jgi:hypothetical protein
MHSILKKSIALVLISKEREAIVAVVVALQTMQRIAYPIPVKSIDLMLISKFRKLCMRLSRGVGF